MRRGHARQNRIQRPIRSSFAMGSPFPLPFQYFRARVYCSSPCATPQRLRRKNSPPRVCGVSRLSNRHSPRSIWVGTNYIELPVLKLPGYTYQPHVSLRNHRAVDVLDISHIVLDNLRSRVGAGSTLAIRALAVPHLFGVRPPLQGTMFLPFGCSNLICMLYLTLRVFFRLALRRLDAAA